MMQFPNVIALATPLFILFVIGEIVVARFSARARFEPWDTATSLMMGFGSTIIGGLFAFVFIAFAAALQPLAVTHIGFSWAALIVCFVVDDFAYYAWHRASHRVRWLWADHVQHHSSQHYNLSTALRQPWTGAFTPGMLFRAPLILVGFPLPMLAFVHGVNLIYQFWIHTEIIGKCPRWFEAVMNTPSHHRVHHATNARYLDANYAGVFIVWDKLFGTFVAENEADKPRYGIVKNLDTFNPLKVALHEWLGMAKDVARAGSLRDAVRYVLAPPGWTPDGSRDTTESIKASWQAFDSPGQPAE